MSFKFNTSEFATSYIPKSQFQIMQSNISRNASDAEYFINKLENFDSIIEAMPESSESTVESESATIFLHYYDGITDWFILEKESGSQQYFAFVDGGDGEPELGKVSIEKLLTGRCNLDLAWRARTLKEVRKEQRESFLHDAPF